jgi:hypothetical protein
MIFEIFIALVLFHLAAAGVILVFGLFEWIFPERPYRPKRKEGP